MFRSKNFVPSSVGNVGIYVLDFEKKRERATAKKKYIKCGYDNDDKRPHKCEQPMRKESNVQNCDNELC